MKRYANIKTLRAVSLLLAASFLATGCATIEGPKPGDDTSFAPVKPVVPASRQQYNGAIYQAGTGMSLFTDTRRVRSVMCLP